MERAAPIAASSNSLSTPSGERPGQSHGRSTLANGNDAGEDV